MSGYDYDSYESRPPPPITASQFMQIVGFKSDNSVTAPKPPSSRTTLATQIGANEARNQGLASAQHQRYQGAGYYPFPFGDYRQHVAPSPDAVHNATFMPSSNEAQAITEPYRTHTHILPPLISTNPSRSRSMAVGQASETASRPTYGMNSNDPQAHYGTPVSAVGTYSLQQAAPSYPPSETPMHKPSDNISPPNNIYRSPIQAYSPHAPPYANPYAGFQLLPSHLEQGSGYRNPGYNRPPSPGTPPTSYTQLSTATNSPPSPLPLKPFHTESFPLRNPFGHPREDSDDEHDPEVPYSRGQQPGGLHAQHLAHAPQHPSTSISSYSRQTDNQSASIQDQSTSQPAPNSPKGGRRRPRSRSPPPPNRPRREERPLGKCIFCRHRSKDGKDFECSLDPNRTDGDLTCNQCARRKLDCSYPGTSRRGLRKHRDRSPPSTLP